MPLFHALVAAACLFPPPPGEDGLSAWRPAERDHQRAFEKILLDKPDSASLQKFHELLAKEPHVAGTPGDARVVDSIASAFRDMGLVVDVQPIWVYLARPKSAAVELLNADSSRTPLITLERPLAEDRFSQNAEAVPAWNAYSGSGDVTGRIVYANYGTKEDFQLLARHKVDLTGKIVLARYGGNFRGYKAKFAEAAGAVGLIIYSDPADGGFCKGPVWPEGGYANDSCIQRGSIQTLPYAGDPLTPFTPAVEDAVRIDPSKVELPRIPVQPVSWAAAKEILSRMTGPAAPKEWQGGLPLEYRFEGGPDVNVRLQVDQERAVMKTANVVGVLIGKEWPEQAVIIGAHHDAWGYGAADPLCGTITVLETARIFAAMAKEGHEPQRSIFFAAWAAEEFGLIGSTEWVEANVGDVATSAVAYINLDMASMGLKFGAGASPSLKPLIASAAAAVQLPLDKTTGSRTRRTVLAEWAERSPDAKRTGMPAIGDLGGGSDHVAFLCHAGCPSMGLSAGGAPGNSYHSVYDNLVWYWKTVGEDYESAKLITRMTSVITARLANPAILPVEPWRACDEMRTHLKALRAIAEKRNLLVGQDGEALARDVFDALDAKAAAAADLGDAFGAALDRFSRDPNAADDLLAAWSKTMLMAMDRAWLDAKGVPARPWYRNLFVAPDEDSGYASWMLPALRWAVEHDDPAALREQATRYADKLDALAAQFQELTAWLNTPPPPPPAAPAPAPAQPAPQDK